jgi:beta-lactamase regulating signal transducer with metallopeptidase domain
MSDFFATLGMGLLLSWIALPLLALTAARARRPEERQATLTLAMALGASLFLAPWVRELSRHITALCVSKETMSVVLPGTAGPILAPDDLLVTVLPTIGIAGAVLIALGAIRLAVAHLSIARVLRAAYPAPAEVVARVQVLAELQGVPAPRVLVMRTNAAPFVARVRAPVLVLPEKLLGVLSPLRFEMVVRHELAHLAHGDLLRAFFVSLLRVPYVLHPIAKWMSKEIALSREQLVDREVGRDDPCAYAELLLDVAAHTRTISAEVAMSAASLDRRICALAEQSNRARAALSSVVLVGMMLLGLVMIAPKSHAASGPGLMTCWEPVGPATEAVIYDDACVAMEACAAECANGAEQCDLN